MFFKIQAKRIREEQTKTRYLFDDVYSGYEYESHHHHHSSVKVEHFILSDCNRARRTENAFLYFTLLLLLLFLYTQAFPIFPC